MIFLTTLSILLVTVLGRPESPLGYQYASSSPTLLNSYTAPLASVGSLRNTSSQLNNSSMPSSLETSSVDAASNDSFVGSSFPPEETSDDNSDGFESSNNVIEKEIYIHLPSPELEQELQPKVEVRVPPPQTRYKIIFVKAPSVSAALPIIPPLPQNEEKTLVYVLLNKQEQQEIVIPTPEPTEPSRPEVYFIRYKAETDKFDEAIRDEEISDSLGQSINKNAGGSVKYGTLT